MKLSKQAHSGFQRYALHPPKPRLLQCARHVRTYLGGKLDEEVVICCEGADAGTLADGGGQRFDLIEAAVELVQRSQPAARGRS